MKGDITDEGLLSLIKQRTTRRFTFNSWFNKTTIRANFYSYKGTYSIQDIYFSVKGSKTAVIIDYRDLEKFLGLCKVKMEKYKRKDMRELKKQIKE